MRLREWPRRVLMVPIRGYQKFISPALAAELPVYAELLAVRPRGGGQVRRRARAAGSRHAASSGVTRSIPAGTTRFPELVT